MVIISDTSCISNLYQINSLLILNEVFGKILVPTKVSEELIFFHGNSFISILELNNIQIRQNKQYHIQRELSKYRLDVGEVEAIALAIELNASLIIDEKKGKAIAINLGIEAVGLLGVLLLAKQKNIIPSLKQLLDDLKLKTTFRFSNSLYNQLLLLANE